MTSVVSTGTSLVVVPAPRSAARLRLVCFPWAGAGPSVFSLWPRGLPPEVEVCLVHLPGRELRFTDPPFATWQEAIASIADALGSLPDRPLALFGHSLGAILAFELARRLRRDGRAAPVQLLVSGRRAPQIPAVRPPFADAPEPVLIDELRRYAGTPEDVLTSPEALEVFLPVIRADFRMNERYVYQAEMPQAVPIVVYGGEQDAWVSRQDLEAWREQTTGTFRRVMFPGGHLFLNPYRGSLLTEVSAVLRRAMLGCRA